jgi:hypothetical protein
VLYKKQQGIKGLGIERQGAAVRIQQQLAASRIQSEIAEFVDPKVGCPVDRAFQKIFPNVSGHGQRVSGPVAGLYAPAAGQLSRE